MQFKLHLNNFLVQILKQNKTVQRKFNVVKNCIKMSCEDITHEDIGDLERKATFYTPSQANFKMEH